MNEDWATPDQAETAEAPMAAVADVDTAEEAAGAVISPNSAEPHKTRQLHFVNSVMTMACLISGCAGSSSESETGSISPLFLLVPAVLLLASCSLVAVVGVIAFFVRRHSRWLSQEEQSVLGAEEARQQNSTES